jgi:23S rRNA pseudouridine1911/1915/1917 synthase
MNEFTASARDAGQRLDIWIESQVADLSRSRLQALIRSGHVTVDGATAKPHLKVRAGMRVRVAPPPPTPSALVAEAILLDVLYEDADLIVINKPAGLVVHPAAGHPSGTLVNALLHHCHDLAGIGGETRPGIVHRLDRDTTGAMVVAKHAQAMAALVDQFKAGGVRKEYVAFVHGLPHPTVGTIESLIGRSIHDRKKMSAQPAHGRPAVTHYRVEEVFGPVAVLRLRIETGRTHQIRVHLAHIGHPVVGDRTYGRQRAFPGADRQMLHAAQLGFTHPRTGKAVEFKAPLPADMATLLAQWRSA